MVKMKKMLRLPLALIAFCTLAVTAQVPLPGPLPPDMLVEIQYVLTGMNGGYPVQTLTVSGTLPGLGVGSGEAVLKTAGSKDSTTKSIPLTDAELRALVELFADNGFSTMDSIFQSGCLACPDFSITYGKKTVRGNTPGGSAGLANIITALNALVKKVKDATPVATSSLPATIQSPQLLIKGTGVRLVLDQGGHVAIRAFGLDGSLLGTVFKGSAPEGTSMYSLGSFTAGAGRAMIVTLTTGRGTTSRTVFCNGNSRQ